MCCFDAEAVMQDSEGLDFLKAVLEVPIGAQPLPGAFVPGHPQPGWSIQPEAASAQVSQTAGVSETV